MKLKNFLPGTLFIRITAIVFSVTLVFLLALNIYARGYNTSSALAADVSLNNSVKPDVEVAPAKAINLGLPARIKIPKIKIDAALESVGLTLQGAVGVPQGLTSAAWFNLGPRPGDIGNAVIVGHYGRWKNGVLTVFNNLSKLRPGDKLSVKDENGLIINFVVRGSKTYLPSDDATEVFISSDGKAHLNLITCEGTWDKISKSYSRRLVVFTDKE